MALPDYLRDPQDAHIRAQVERAKSDNIKPKTQGIMTEQIELTGNAPDLGCDALLGVSVTAVGPDTANYEKGSRITLMREDGKTFSVNVPDSLWGCGFIHGLNMVFDHSGEGDHYT